jgi:hypothetical protein
LIAASVSWFIPLSNSMGVKDRRFSSNPAHKYSQLDLDITIRVLMTIRTEDRKKNGVLIIKICGVEPLI